MSVIIRLQNLPWAANALDIRQFFKGLSIPEGGVHIVGGELGDAFIAFSTDEDARQAFNLNGGKIKEIQIKLMLSSRTEMQKVIETARNPLAAFMQKIPPVLPAPVPAVVPTNVPDYLKKGDSKEKEKRDRRRSRSRSRDRRGDSRDRERRDRRRRDRSRSRSRDRRDRKRRDRSRSKDRQYKESDRFSKERKLSEEKVISLQPQVVPNIQKDTNQAVVWTNNVPVVQTPSILNSLIPAQLQQTQLLLNYRNGLQSQAALSQVVNAWNVSNLLTQADRRIDLTGLSFQEELKAVGNRILNNRNKFENESRTNFGRPQRVSRFDVPFEKPPLSIHPPTTKGPHPLDRLDGRLDSDFAERTTYGTLRSDKYERDRQVTKNCCIQLKSFYGGYSEVRKFFNGIFIHNNGIKFLNDNYGKRTGIVYIRFASPTGKERALEKNGMVLRDSNIDLDELNDEIFDKAIDRYFPSNFNETKQGRDDSDIFSNETSSCLVIDDLPLFTKEQDMLKIFSNYSLQQIILQNRQKYVVAYIKFTSSDDAQTAAKDQSQSCFDDKPLKLRFCPEREYQAAHQEQEDIVDLIDEDDEAPTSVVMQTDCVSLSGLPKKTTDRDVSDFFSDVAIIPSKIHLISSNFGFTGQAYCEFGSTQDVQTALQKNGLPLGPGIVKVIPILRCEMEANIGSAIPRNPSKPFIEQPILSDPPRNTELSCTNDNYVTKPNQVSQGALYFEPPPVNNDHDSSKGDEYFETPMHDEDYSPSQNYDQIPDKEDNYEFLPDENSFQPQNFRPDNQLSYNELDHEPPVTHQLPDNPDYSNNDNLNFGNRNYQSNNPWNRPANNKSSEKLNFEAPDFNRDNSPSIGRDYEIPTAGPNIKSFLPNNSLPESINEPNYEQMSERRNIDGGKPNYTSFSDDRSMSPQFDNGNYPHNNRMLEPDDFSHSRHFNFNRAPDMKWSGPPITNFDDPYSSRGKPPPLMSIARAPPVRRLPPPVNPSDMAEPGCTLLMQNVPYKAGLDDILNFFEGFDVHADNILRRYNDNGTPSGEAKVIFGSQGEAYEAFRQYNMSTIRERTIYLSQC